MGERWTHAMCDSCWDAMYPQRRAVRMSEPMGEPCCWCGANTTSGIYIRKQPMHVPCMGRRGALHRSVQPTEGRTA